MHPLIVLVDTLPAEGQTFTVRLSLGEADAYLRQAGVQGVRVLDAIEGQMRVLPSGAEVFVLGELSGRVAYRCVRCLEEFATDLAAEFHLTFAPERDVEGGEIELHREDLDTEPLRDRALDLTSLVLEQIDLNLDPHPVCRDACKGLCGHCGADWNQGPCSCGEPPPDPRLALLKDWGKRKQGGAG